MIENILEVKKLVKTFPGVRALDGVDFTLKRGSVHAIVGENGAGKSTLMMTLGGVYQPDSGEILFEGQPVVLESPNEANKKGISVVYQELSLVTNLSIAENIFVNRQPVKRGRLIKWDKLHQNTFDLMKRFSMENLSPSQLVGNLSLAERQVVEILKAMSHEPKILILDEPTSSLTEQETKELFKNIKLLKEDGISIIYITHHLKELFEIADEVTVLRDGKYVCNSPVSDIDEDYLVTNMVGRAISNMYGIRESNQKIGDTYFQVENLSQYRRFNDVSFHIRKGEIVGFAGLVGAGRTELGRAIFGAEHYHSGRIVLDGTPLTVKTTKKAIASGIGYLSEDRKNHGLFLNSEINNNIVSSHLSDFSTDYGFLKNERIDAFASEKVEEFNIVTPSIYQRVENLSGGNQQKVLVSMWFGISPRLLIVDEPTRGVDVGAKSEIYKLIRRLAATGVGVMVISSDLSEIIGLCDRVYIMRQGSIAGEVENDDITEENIIGLATGVYKELSHAQKQI
jgi:ABC-type sugar transport system ATPase subunit